jgi:hypothetical protein
MTHSAFRKAYGLAYGLLLAVTSTVAIRAFSSCFVTLRCNVGTFIIQDNRAINSCLYANFNVPVVIA